MLRTVFFILVLVLSAFVNPALAGEVPPVQQGRWIEFHGWRPDSRAYAYTIIERTVRHDRIRERRKSRLTKVDREGKPHRKALAQPGGDYAEKRGFLHAPARTDRPTEETVLFFLDDGREMWFELLLGNRLGYSVTVREGADETEVGRGRFKDLYGSFDAFAFVSPDGRRVVVVIYGENPYEVVGEVHFFNLPKSAGSRPQAPSEASDTTSDRGVLGAE